MHVEFLLLMPGEHEGGCISDEQDQPTALPWEWHQTQCGTKGGDHLLIDGYGVSSDS